MMVACNLERTARSRRVWDPDARHEAWSYELRIAELEATVARLRRALGRQTTGATSAPVLARLLFASLQLLGGRTVVPFADGRLELSLPRCEVRSTSDRGRRMPIGGALVYALAVLIAGDGWAPRLELLYRYEPSSHDSGSIVRSRVGRLREALRSVDPEIDLVTRHGVVHLAVRVLSGVEEPALSGAKG